MLKSNHYNLYTGIGEKLKLYKEKVYRLRPNVQNEFVDEKYNCIAKRLTIPLEQDAVYKTQFFNEMLACALQPLNNDTQFILYNADGKVENPYKYLPTLSEDYASIICQIEPEKPFTEISIVIYCGPDINKILLSDGSVTMDADYVPTKDTDVITKEYADRLIENFTAFSYPLKHFTIKQGNVGPIGAYCFLDNSFYDKVLFIRNHNTMKRMDDCEITTDSFALPNTFTKNVQIGLVVDGTTTHTARISEILDGTDPNWTLMNTDNVYTGTVDQIYWRNAYSLRFNLESFLSKYSASKPYMNIGIKVWDEEGHTRYSDIVVYGIDEYIESAKSLAKIEFIDENFTKFKSKFVSGEGYFENDFDKVYELPITLTIENNFLQFFRLKNNLKLSVENDAGEETFACNLPIISHQPVTGTFKINTKIEFTLASKTIHLRAYNVKDELMYDETLTLNAVPDNSDESNRVTTPASSETYPSSDYGNPWDSKAPLQDWDMKLKEGEYTSNTLQSAVCFVTKPKDCYSHINIDIDHDGDMYILSEGNTGWLNCQKTADAFKIPTNNGHGCKLNEGYFTFGKVNYKSKVFIRIIGATKVVFKSAILG